MAHSLLDERRMSRMETAFNGTSKLSTVPGSGGSEGVTLIHRKASDRRPEEGAYLSRSTQSAEIAVSRSGHGRAEGDIAVLRWSRNSRINDSNRIRTPPLGVANGRGRCRNT